MMKFPYYPWMKKELPWVWPAVKDIVLTKLREDETIDNLTPLSPIRMLLLDRILAAVDKFPRWSPERSELVARIWMAISFALWDITKGVYRFDRDFFGEVMDTELLTTDLPAHVLLQMPEPAIFIQFPYPIKNLGALDGKDADIEGVLVIMDTRGEKIDESGPDLASNFLITFGMQLYLCYEGGVYHHSLDLDRENLAECLRIVRVETGGPNGKIKVVTRSQSEIKFLASIINLILYICSLGADVTFRGEPSMPSPLRAKKIRHKKRVTWIIDGPASIVERDVGVYEGAKLRRYREQNPEEDNGKTLAGSRHSPRPHKRRAHWHLYHTRKGPKVKWVKVCLVNFPDDLAEKGLELPVVVRNVERVRQTTVMTPLDPHVERAKHQIKFGKRK